MREAKVSVGAGGGNADAKVRTMAKRARPESAAESTSGGIRWWRVVCSEVVAEVDNFGSGAGGACGAQLRHKDEHEWAVSG